LFAGTKTITRIAVLPVVGSTQGRTKRDDADKVIDEKMRPERFHALAASRGRQAELQIPQGESTHDQYEPV
jgi:hypothetical protein